MKKSAIHRYLPLFLFGYHLLFAYLAWDYVTENKGDALRYWFVGQDLSHQSWFSFFQPGTDLIKLFTFPFVKFLNLPFWGGFVLFSILSYVGIYRLYHLLMQKAGDHTLLQFLVFLLLLLPNLHFWTSNIGKEAVLILPLVIILKELSKEKYCSLPLIFSLLFVTLIRPHVAFVLVLSAVIAAFLVFRLSTRKIFLLGGGFIAVTGLLALVLVQLQDFSGGFERIIKKYETHIAHFKNTAGYVPLDEYTFPYKIFTFYFRPLPLEKEGIFYHAISLENMVLFLLCGVTLFYSLKYFKSLKTNFLFVFSVTFLLLLASMYVYAYANYGLIMRTKMMALPFIYVYLLEVFKHALIKTGHAR